MNIALLLEMAADGAPERVALGPRSGGASYRELLRLARNSGKWLASQPGPHAGLLDGNSAAVPLLLFGSALAGKAFVPVSYRLAAASLRAVLGRLGQGVLVTAPDAALPGPLPEGLVVTAREQFLSEVRGGATDWPTGSPAPEDVAALLFTSGTTGTPKAAVLRHRQLAAYIIGTVEFLSAEPGDAALISVPPYHIAGISGILSSVYAGRRIVQLDAFEPRAWVRLVNDESVTHAMVVPTMLSRILDVLLADGERLPSLRHLSYGGGRMPSKTIETALRLLPHVDFVNAYGLTETSSTIAVLGPDDHRRFATGDAAGRRRLNSVGRPLPSVQIEIRGPGGKTLGPGVSGEVFVRGEQVAGEYLDGARLNDGWFATRDAGYLDADGYLFLDGRLDDIIVRGGENLSPGEIEDVLVEHPAVREAAVVGLPDPEWGEQVVAVVVPAAGAAADAAVLQRWVRERLRSSRTPARVEFVPSLPYTETGKLLRRQVRDQIRARLSGCQRERPWLAVARRATMHYMTSPLSVRLNDATIARLGRHAQRVHLAPRTLAQRYVEEGLRMDEHPLIRFAEGPAGRRARLMGTGKDVWEVIAAVRDNGGDIAESARYLELSLGLVQAAVTYYGAYTDEIDQWIEANAQEAAEAHAAWAAGKSAVQR